MDAEALDALVMELQSARSVWRQSSRQHFSLLRIRALQSARSVWRQRYLLIALAFLVCVAICTERVEAKFRRGVTADSPPGCNLHGACGGKERMIEDAPKRQCCNLHGACGGKASSSVFCIACCGCNLHGACGGKVIGLSSVFLRDNVAICTERVEAKFCEIICAHFFACCNLHGACGGKADIVVHSATKFIGCNLHGACGGKATCKQRPARFPTVAICTERVEAK